LADKPARLVHPADAVHVAGEAPRFVSRGGIKLEAAIEHFGIEVKGKQALDAGASTGGFTDCLLQRGAVRVVAVDVGYGQLHERLRADERVVPLERTNIRHLRLAMVGGTPFPIVTADLSFISLLTVLPVLLPLAAPGADVVLLVKPQFEAGRAEASRGRGVIRDPDVWRRVLQNVAAALEAEDAAMMGIMVSPLRGADGNVEFLTHACAHGRAHERAAAPIDLDALLDEVDEVD
jgi:23S rRNA (cytidine1920-2'-O)/16S rRNA (cytidine1409-2'-O)-methyltransferase